MATSGNQAYQNTVSLKFVVPTEGIAEDIDNQFVKFIVIYDNYENNVMPVIFVSLSILSPSYTNVIKYESKGYFDLVISRRNTFSNTALEKTDISGRFLYILNTSNPNYIQELNYDPTADNSYQEIFLGLFNVDILNKSKDSYNGILNDIDMATLMFLAMANIDKIVIKGPKYNPTFQTEILPALNSKKRLLQYLFNQSPFYDTDFTFFMDFNRSYLIDQTGEGCKVEDGTLHDVIFDIQQVTEDEAYYEGMMEKEGAYYLYINPARTDIALNKGQDKVANQLINVDELGDISMINLNINKHEKSTIKRQFQRGQDAVLKKNILESNSIFIDISKPRINGSLFTPNKKYQVKNYPDYEDYDGVYVLSYKNEIMENRDGIFDSSVQFGLRKINNIEAIGTASAMAASNQNRSAVNYTGNPTSLYNTSGKSVQSARSSARPSSSRRRTSAANPQSLSAANIRPLDASFAGPIKSLKARQTTENLQREFRSDIPSKTIKTVNGETEE